MKVQLTLLCATQDIHTCIISSGYFLITYSWVASGYNLHPLTSKYKSMQKQSSCKNGAALKRIFVVISWPQPFDFTTFFTQPFQGRTFLQLGCFLKI